MTAQTSNPSSGKTKPPSASFRDFLRNSKIITVFLFLLLLAACISVILVPDNIYQYREGQVASRQVNAEVAFIWSDTAKTETRRREAIAALPIFFALDTAKDDLLRKYIQTFFESARKKNLLPPAAEKDFLPAADLPERLKQELKELHGKELSYVATMHAWQDTMERHLAEGIISVDKKNLIRWDKQASVKGRNERIHQLPARELETPEEALYAILQVGLRKAPVVDISGSKRKELVKRLCGCMEGRQSGKRSGNDKTCQRKSHPFHSAGKRVCQSR